MKTFEIIEETPVLMVRRFRIEAETFEEAVQKIKDVVDEDDELIEPITVEYEENLDKPMYYLDEKQTNP